jgi:hypothetical protein
MFNPVVKDRLFYDQFEFCIKFHLEEVSCLRTLDHAQIDRMIERRVAWRSISQTLYSRPLVTQLSNQSNVITETTVKNLHILADVLLTTTEKFKLVVSAFTGYVYTNNTALIKKIAKLPGIKHAEYSRSVVGRPKNTIQLKDPKYQWRSYFKLSKLSTEQKTQLQNFLINQPDIRLSPGLKQWIMTKFTRTQDYFFIDYNEQLWLTMLALVQPGLIRKTLEIIPAK